MNENLIGERVCCVGDIAMWGTDDHTGMPAYKIEGAIRAAGGHYNSQVMPHTTLVVKGRNPDGELARAGDLGIKVIGEDEFILRLEASRLLIKGAPKLLEAARGTFARQNGAWSMIPGKANFDALKSAILAATPRENEYV